ncbi:MAG TPA: hypothetical protein VE198_09960 [Actinoallomurus sp.]|nr:hypothetical protein [Actinoallomurus sp.]
MFGRRETGFLSAVGVNTARLAVVGLTALGSSMSLPASADDQHNGNGKFNRISSPFNSPNHMRGVQHVINANSGGSTINQSSFCKRKVHCRFVQKAYLGGW